MVIVAIRIACLRLIIIEANYDLHRYFLQTRQIGRMGSFLTKKMVHNYKNVIKIIIQTFFKKHEQSYNTFKVPLKNGECYQSLQETTAMPLFIIISSLNAHWQFSKSIQLNPIKHR